MMAGLVGTSGFAAIPTWIYDTNDCATLGFNMHGIESLKELIADQKR
jgi:hypothetical protein